MDDIKLKQNLEQKKFNTTNERKNAEYLMGLGFPKEKAINMAYKQGTSAGLTPYEKKVQELQAKKEFDKQQAIEEKQRGYEESNLALDDTINFVNELPESVVGPYSGFLQDVGAFTGGNVGFKDKQQMLKGELDRRVGEIENKIIAVARANGQTGINTMQEIKQAAKGIATARSKQALLGALKHMQDLNNKYIELGKQQIGGKDKMPKEQEQVVDYTAYFGG